MSLATTMVHSPLLPTQLSTWISALTARRSVANSRRLNPKHGFSAEANPQHRPLREGCGDAKSQLEDELLVPVIQSLFKIIKCFHHLRLLSEGVPKSLSETAKSLTSRLYPAFNNQAFEVAATEISDRWLIDTTSALKAHYKAVVCEAEDFLRVQPLQPEQLEISISVAIQWARRQLGKKLRDESLYSALTHVRSLHSSTSAQLREESAMLAEPILVVERTCVATQTDSSEDPGLSDTEPTSEHASDSSETSAFTSQDPMDRKQPRPNSSPPRRSQLDLFSTPLQEAWKRAISDTEVVVFGDANLRDFNFPRSAVLAHDNGRLSHFKALLTSTRSSFNSVKKFALCLSTLDSGNCYISNSWTLKDVLGSAHRVFPLAKLFVLLLGNDKNVPQHISDNVHALNSFIMNNHPSSCLHIPPYQNFKSLLNRWDEETRKASYDKLSQFLN